MKNVRFVTALLSFLCFISESKAQNVDSICMQQLLVVGNMQAFHIDPPSFDKKTNLEILELFFEKSDARSYFFHKSDREKMKETIGEYSSNDGYCKTITEAVAVLKNRKAQIDSILKVLENKKMVFSEKDSITFLARGSNTPVLNDTKQLQAKIERKLKYDCLNYIVKPVKEGEEPSKLKGSELDAKIVEAKKRALSRFRRYLDNFSSDNKIKHYIGDAFSNAIVHRCDPHSNYFNLYDKEQWDAGLSSQELSFGFEVDENEAGDIIVSELAPGGPAWKSNELHEGDVLLAFEFEKEKEVELSGMELEDFYYSFYRSAGKIVELTFRLKDNQIKKVKLQKAKVASLENLMNSYILKKDGKKIGYIPIPAFYSDDEMDNRQGCANDVAKEIVKLKQDSIEGLIIDLRYNGGGSMKEAMGLAGIFIDYGPVAVFKQKGVKPSLLKDLNRGTIYDGPLVVLVNGGSASASEFVTAALQDYERAVIVGSTTYGKGTAQMVLPADTNLYKARGKKYYINPTFGYVSITMGKFYRVNTISHQGKGILPDISIPDLSEKIMTRESEQKYFIPADSVDKKVVFTKSASLPLDWLREKSAKRIGADIRFKEIIGIADSLENASKSEFKLALSVPAFIKYDEILNKQEEKISAAMDNGEESPLNVKNNAYTAKLIQFDEFQKKINDDAIDNIKSDIILSEAFFIIKDLTNFQKE